MGVDVDTTVGVGVVVCGGVGEDVGTGEGVGVGKGKGTSGRERREEGRRRREKKIQTNITSFILLKRSQQQISFLLCYPSSLFLSLFFLFSFSMTHTCRSEKTESE